MRQPTFERLIRFLLCLIPIVFFIYCLWMYFAVSGHWAVSYDFSSDPSSVISDFTPSGRALARVKNLENGKTTQQIVGDPVYMTVRPPQTFDRVEATIDFAAQNQSVVSIGMVLNFNPWSVHTQPLMSTVVSEAEESGWQRIQDGDFTILQRQEYVQSVEEIQSLPSDVRIATYGAQLPAASSGIAPSNDDGQDIPMTLPASLQGPHDMHLFLHAGTQARFAFKMDMPSSATTEAALIELRDHSGEQIASARFVDGEASLNHFISTSGAYRLIVSVPQDAILYDIVLPSQRVVASNWAIYGTTQSEIRFSAPLKLYTTGRRATLLAFEYRGLNTHQFADEEVIIDNEHEPVHAYTSEQETSTLELESSGVLVSSNAPIGFFIDALFDPRGNIHAIDETTELDDVDMIVMSRLPAIEEYTQYNRYTASMDIRSVVNQRQGIEFLLSAPGILEHHGFVRVYRVRYDFFRDPLWVKAYHKLQDIWQ